MRKIKTYWKIVALVLTPVIAFYPVAVLAQSSSTNYRLEEAYFGTGGELDASSTNYRSQQSVGSLGVGNTSSANYDANGGFLTQSEPFLAVEVTGADLDLGTLSPSAASYQASQGGTCSCTFYVRSYLSSGYTVVTASQPPTNESGDVLTAKGTQGAASSDPDVEEFGINLVANTSPGSFGADPSNQPDNTFADGQAATGYQTTNQYKYGAGEVIARSQATAGNQGVGQTNYTISYIMKISNQTPAGLYSMEHDLIVVPVY